MIGNGLSSSSGHLVVSIIESIRSEFGKKVLTSGGTVEENKHLMSRLDEITKVKPDADILRAFQKRVQLAGGSVESPSSAFDAIEDLTPSRSFELSVVTSLQERVSAEGGRFENLEAAFDAVNNLT
tara:strand:- start:331 stop:708 length:378 start_codon:yes stop_codon:yes gene_type:complete